MSPMKPGIPLACAFLFGCVSGIGQTPVPSLASFAGTYKPTVRNIQLADDNDVFDGGHYRRFKLKIKRSGRGRGQAIYYSPDGISTERVKIKVQVSKFRWTGKSASAEVLGVGNDDMAFFGSADLTPPSRKRSILISLVKGDYHSFALLVSR